MNHKMGTCRLILHRSFANNNKKLTVKLNICQFNINCVGDIYLWHIRQNYAKYAIVGSLMYVIRLNNILKNESRHIKNENREL